MNIARQLEQYKICHNDLWDNNIIVTDTNNIIVIDHEYFTCVDHIPDTILYASRKELIRMGWSKRFRIGSDMNQILGCMQKYKYMPANLKRFINKRLIKYVSGPDAKEFPYAINHSNKKLSARSVNNYVTTFL